MPDIDYSSKMPDTIFTYDKDFYTDDLPDPQIDPVLPGARVPLKKVGIAPVDLPVVLRSREGGEKVQQTEASLYCSLDDPMAKGLNLSRLYLIMHEQIKDKLSLDGMEGALRELAEKQGSKNA
jgi:GTP cyclohydrolase FolE2